MRADTGKRPLRYLTMIVTIFIGPIVGCSSSEETGAARSDGGQEQVGPITSGSQTATPPAAVQLQGADQTDPLLADPTIRRGSDTVQASTQRLSRPAAQRQPLVKPPNAMYTVQVGAFRRAPNALALQRDLKTRVGNHAVFSLFAPNDGLYRVTIGKFETIREAYNYRLTLLDKDPTRFSACWVTYIERDQ